MIFVLLESILNFLLEQFSQLFGKLIKDEDVSVSFRCLSVDDLFFSSEIKSQPNRDLIQFSYDEIKNFEDIIIRIKLNVDNTCECDWSFFNLTVFDPECKKEIRFLTEEDLGEKIVLTARGQKLNIPPSTHDIIVRAKSKASFDMLVHPADSFPDKIVALLQLPKRTRIKKIWRRKIKYPETYDPNYKCCEKTYDAIAEMLKQKKAKGSY